MPIYEYECGVCGHRLEVLQRLGEPAPSGCPACGKGALRKLMSAAGFRLSGGGWYETDFKTDGKRNIAGDAKPDAKSDAQSDAKSTEGKGADAKPSGKDAGAKHKKTSGESAPPKGAAAKPSKPSPSATS